MAEHTEIAWCHSTFNPWIGCSKVAQGCTNCYAEAFSKRTGMAKWGPAGTRVKTSESYWRQPLKWNRDAEAAGERRRVFCASLADVFEDWDGNIIDHTGELLLVGEVRQALFRLIDQTPWLDWLLLTKRPENIRRMWPPVPWTTEASFCQKPRPNVWLGTSIANQSDADRNLAALLGCRELAPVLFVSAEPLLGPVDLKHVQHEGVVEFDALNGTHGVLRPHRGESPRLDLVIVGGESGHHARPMHPAWARSLRDQCVAASVPFFFKQWGAWIRAGAMGEHCFNPGAPVRELVTMNKVGKKAAGRVLDGRTWDEMPAAGVVCSRGARGSGKRHVF